MALVKCVRSLTILGLLVALQSVQPARAMAAEGLEQVASEPQQGAFLNSPPRRVTVTLSERLRKEGSFLGVIAPGGLDVSAGSTELGLDGRTLSVPLRSELPDGLYTVVWGAVADASGAHGEGGFDFGLRAGASLPTLRVDRPSASAGDTISIFGTGFKVGGSVVVSASVDHELVDALRADSRGSIEARIRLPSSLPWGTQRITAADGDGASAIATVQIASSVAPPIRARVVPTSHAQSVELAINVVNRSGYDLRLAEVRLGVPAGAIFARADSGGRPSGLREVGWDGLRLAPGERLTMTATFDTRGLPDPTEVSSAATIRYVHPFEDTADNASLPRFRGSITTDPGVIRVGGLD